VRRLLAAWALTVLLTPAPASAQVPLPPPPPPPEELGPVFEVVAPIASPLCGNALLLASLAPGLIAAQLGAPLPVDVLPLLSPLVVACGAVPTPGVPLTCVADNQVMAVLNTASGQVLGAPLPLVVRFFGPIVEEVIILQDALPPPASTTGLAELAVGALGCLPSAGSAAPPATDPPTETTRPPDTTVPVDAPVSLGFGPIGPTRGITLGPAPILSPPAAPPPSPPTQPAPVTVVQPVAISDEFAYPIVFALPLLLLLVGGYLGWAMTQPVDSPRRPRSTLAQVTNRGEGA
jgi:hypothetical protein